MEKFDAGVNESGGHFAAAATLRISYDFLRNFEMALRELSSVADQGCLSRILILPIPDPGSQIPDPKTAMKDRKNIPFFWSHKFHKIELFYF